MPQPPALSTFNHSSLNHCSESYFSRARRSLVAMTGSTFRLSIKVKPTIASSSRSNLAAKQRGSPAPVAVVEPLPMLEPEAAPSPRQCTSMMASNRRSLPGGFYQPLYPSANNDVLLPTSPTIPPSPPKRKVVTKDSFGPADAKLLHNFQRRSSLFSPSGNLPVVPEVGKSTLGRLAATAYRAVFNTKPSSHNQVVEADQENDNSNSEMQQVILRRPSRPQQTYGEQHPKKRHSICNPVPTIFENPVDNYAPPRNVTVSQVSSTVHPNKRHSIANSFINTSLLAYHCGGDKMSVDRSALIADINAKAEHNNNNGRRNSLFAALSIINDS